MYMYMYYLLHNYLTIYACIIMMMLLMTVHRHIPITLLQYYVQWNMALYSSSEFESNLSGQVGDSALAVLLRFPGNPASMWWSSCPFVLCILVFLVCLGCSLGIRQVCAPTKHILISEENGSFFYVKFPHNYITQIPYSSVEWTITHLVRILFFNVFWNILITWTNTLVRKTHS